MLACTCLSDLIAPVPNKSAICRAVQMAVIGVRLRRNSAAAARHNTNTSPSRPEHSNRKVHLRRRNKNNHYLLVP